MHTLRLATRNSPLALKQAELIKLALEQTHTNLHIEVIGFTTTGDRLLGTPLASQGGKGLFVKELEQALLNQNADLAVHSVKDMPVQSASGLMLAAICKRADARDAFISNHYMKLEDLPLGASIGTASLRRQCQLKAVRPDLIVHSLRGNVNSRIQKLDAEQFDAIILAAAGLTRLGLSTRISSYLDVQQFIPAVGQGALGLECRRNDPHTLELVQALNHPPSYYCIMAERAMNRHLQGGCQVPIGAYATIEDKELILKGMVGKIDGSILLTSQSKGCPADAEKIGMQVAKELLLQGAGNILQEIYNLND
jgi:hydroxymethylbilane synthase